MNAEITEMKTLEEAAKSDESIDILALSFDDLDLIGGGNAIGASY